MRFIFIYFFLSICTIATAGGNKMTAEEYIEKYKDDAIHEMKRTGVPASITLAQGLLESGNGNSTLATEANNHFGIKCHNGWTGATYLKDDDKKNDCFRKYRNARESFEDHSDFLKNGKRYAFLFEYDRDNYKAWAHGLKKAGYATNPKYPELLITMIERYQLDQYDGKDRRHSNKDKDREKDREKNREKEGEKDIVIRVNRINLSDNFIKSLVVKNGENLSDISTLTGISEKRLMRYNEKSNTDIVAGELLYLQPKRRSAREKFYTVEHKENLLSISHKFGVTTKSIRKRNNIPLDKDVEVGQKLKLKGKKIKPELNK